MSDGMQPSERREEEEGGGGRGDVRGVLKEGGKINRALLPTAVLRTRFLILHATLKLPGHSLSWKTLSAFSCPSRGL